MAETTTVKVNRRDPIGLPVQVRRQLNIQPGDRLGVDVQDGALLLTPQPENDAAYLAGLHPEIWADVDRDEDLRQERDAWAIPRTD